MNLRRHRRTRLCTDKMVASAKTSDNALERQVTVKRRFHGHQRAVQLVISGRHPAPLNSFACPLLGVGNDNVRAGCRTRDEVAALIDDEIEVLEPLQLLLHRPVVAETLHEGSVVVDLSSSDHPDD